jgi:hypothetical protein
MRSVLLWWCVFEVVAASLDSFAEQAWGDNAGGVRFQFDPSFGLACDVNATLLPAAAGAAFESVIALRVSWERVDGVGDAVALDLPFQSDDASSSSSRGGGGSGGADAASATRRLRLNATLYRFAPVREVHVRV